MVAELFVQAEALVEEFCRQLRQLLQQVRQEQRVLENDARQLRRLLDELEVRLELAEEGVTPAPTADQWRENLASAHQQEQRILSELAEVEEAGRRLELLLRQVEMSGRSLRSDAQIQSYDPWELALQSQVLYGREQERVALAREVHDGPAQVLSNLTLGLEQCRQSADRQERQALLADLLRDTRLGLQEVRRFIYDLRPSPLAEEPLGRQIERYIRDMSATYQVEVTLRWGTPDELSPEETVAIYRIIQEALRNAYRHSRAAQITVETYTEPAAWVVCVVDDGVGFNPDLVWREEDHWGIIGMRERARLIGADLQIESQAGEGTEVRLRRPLHVQDRLEEQVRDGEGKR